MQKMRGRVSDTPTLRVLVEPRSGGVFYCPDVVGVPEVLRISGLFNGLQESGTEKHAL